MKAFRDRSSPPDGGGICIFVDPETGQSFRHPYIGQVELQVRNFYRANQRPIKQGFALMVEDRICQDTPGADCIEVEDYKPPSQLSLLERTIQFGRAMIEWARSGFTCVSPEQYRERFQTCTVDDGSGDPCPEWNGEATFGYGKCGACGCTRVKLFLATEKCPKHKWKI